MKIWHLAVVFVVALVAIWVSNNVTAVQNVVG
jgi:hypothetical protein